MLYFDHLLGAGIPQTICLTPGNSCPPDPPPKSQGSRSGFLSKWFFGGLEYQGQTTTHFQNTNGFKNSGKANTNTRFWKMCGVLASVPQASKKPFGLKIISESLWQKAATIFSLDSPAGSCRPPDPPGKLLTLSQIPFRKLRFSY